MCRLLLPLLFMLLMPFGALSANPASPASILSSFRDRDEAERTLGGLPLQDIEGIWEYPADEAAVAILRDERAKGRYLILWVDRDPPASASQALGLKVCTTTLG